MVLQIRHTGYQANDPTFSVSCLGDIKQSESVALPSPSDFPLTKYPKKVLLHELRWYLENYLDAPFGIYQEEAYCVNETMKKWGNLVFCKLFSGCAQDWYEKARYESLKTLQIVIICDSPEIMSWPWETLYSDEDGYLSQRCHIIRQLSKIGNPPVLPKISQTTLNILFIISRPFGDGDIGYHTLIKNVIDYVHESKKSVTIEVLRPPTFDQLRKVLRERPNHYHIVHFDGHGSYGDTKEVHYQDTFAAFEGNLVFETEECDPDYVGSEMLAQLLAEYKIPIMVLNACQSGMIHDQAKDPFACVAASLLRAGIRSVAAMGYSLYVSGAKQFVPAFYERLFSNGDIPEAMRAGRNAMFRYPKRTCIVGEMPLSDWIVPVLYQQILDGEKILPKIVSLPDIPYCSPFPQEVQELGDYGLIGRELYIQKLDRAMQCQHQAGILLYGQAGMGKTTLVKGFLHWLKDTSGLHGNVYWFNFQEIFSVESILNILSEKLFGITAVSEPYDQKFSRLIQSLKNHSHILVWDNFESASGIDGTEISSNLSNKDRNKLLSFLKKLRGGQSKILITSRTEEKWLTIQACYRITELNGFLGEELWEYCNTIMGDLGLTFHRKDPVYQEIIKKLCGNPLAIRAVLLRLGEQSANEILEELDSAFHGLEGDDSTKRIQAAYEVFGKNLLERFSPILQLTGLHEYYVYTDFISEMLLKAEISVEEDSIDACYQILKDAGFCTYKDQNIFQLHPALRGYLLKRLPPSVPIKKGFLEVMGLLADILIQKPWNKKNSFYERNIANFYYARRLADELGMNQHYMAFTQCLAFYSNEKRQFSIAETLYQDLAERAFASGDEKFYAASLHQLGTIAQAQRDFSTAEDWYKKSLAIKWKNHDENGAATTYYQLGILSQEQLDFSNAEVWCKKSLAIELKNQNELGVYKSYHLLGILAEESRDFSAAQEWYKKSLALELKNGDEQSAAVTYHQLGTVSEALGDFSAAQEWCEKSLSLKEKIGDIYGMSITYHLLGRIMDAQQNFPAAEKWFKKSLEKSILYQDEHQAAITYHQLGILAEKKKDFSTAEEWFKKSVALKLKYQDKYSAASSYHHLGIVFQEQKDFSAAKDWYQKSLEIKLMYNNDLDASSTYHQLGILAQEQQDFTAAEEWLKKSLAIKIKYQEEQSAAITYHQLGILASKQKRFSQAADYLIKAGEIFISKNNPQNLISVMYHFALLLRNTPFPLNNQLYRMWEQHKLLNTYTVELKQMEEKINETNNS